MPELGPSGRDLSDGGGGVGAAFNGVVLSVTGKMPLGGGCCGVVDELADAA